MDKELEQYYESYFDLFNHPGWKQFIEDMEANHEAINNLSTIASSEEFWHKKGQTQLLQRIINLPILMNETYRSLMVDSEQ